MSNTTKKALPSLWRSVALGRVCKPLRGVTFNNGDTIENEFTNSIACLTTSGVQDEVDWSSRRFIPFNRLLSEEQVLQPGDILVSTANSKPLVGKSCLIREVPFPCTFGAFVTVLRPYGLVDPYLLWKWLQTSEALMYFFRTSSNTTNISNLRVTDLMNFQIPLPPLREQYRIASILHQADELQSFRRKADDQAAELLPALFHHMFISSQNRKDWKLEMVENLALPRDGSIRTGPFGSDLRHAEFREEGIPVLGIDNVSTNEFRWTEKRCITPKKYEALRRFRVFPNDVLVTIMGTVGRCCVTPLDLPECISTKHLCAITFDQNKVHPFYMWGTFLFDPNIRQQTRSAGGGAIMEGWNTTIIKRLKVRVPPPSLQLEFAQRVAVFRDIELQRQYSTKGINDLFQSLLSQAFSGELTAVWREQHIEELVVAAEERDRLLDELSSAPLPKLDDNYNVIINGNAEGVVIGDNARVFINGNVDGIIIGDNTTIYGPIIGANAERIFTGRISGSQGEVLSARQDLITTLSPEQREVYRQALSIESHITPDSLSENSGLSLIACRQGLSLLAAAGLLLPVSIRDRATGRWVPAYRPLRPEDTSLADDIDMLKVETA